MPEEAAFHRGGQRSSGTSRRGGKAAEAFAADVAHELRTPLALLSLELDQIDHPHAQR
jgi:signal transduction histidine kinase